jgi:hypothetical protein
VATTGQCSRLIDKETKQKVGEKVLMNTIRTLEADIGQIHFLKYVETFERHNLQDLLSFGPT